MRWLLAGMSLVVAALTPLHGAPTADGPAAGAAFPVVRIALVGDVMVGRGISPILEQEPDAVFAGVRHLLTGADLAAANLESPLTEREPVDPDRHDLRALPAAAEVLAAAGFDVLALANNHAADAGPGGVNDTRMAIVEAGMLSVGAGPTSVDARRPAVVDLDGTTVGFLAFDATGAGLADGGLVNRWHRMTGPAAVRDLADQVDVVIVGVHGGSEYLATPDPFMTELAATAIRAGADVVWGHGAHVVQPISVTARHPRAALVATSLGNLVFDQFGPDRTTGLVLEVLADRRGVIAHRATETRHADRRVEVGEGDAPTGDAVWYAGSWWTIVRRPVLAAGTAVTVPEFHHHLTAAGAGDVTGDGAIETVIAFRRPYAPTPYSTLLTERRWFDQRGRSAHVGVYRGPDLDEVWVAGTVLHPVGGLEVCDGGLSLLHTALDDTAPVGVAAWTWNGFGFDTSPLLAGHARVGCADLDGDGRTEPVALAR